MHSVITTTLRNGTTIQIKVDHDVYQKYRNAKFNVSSDRVRIGRDYFHKVIMPEAPSEDMIIWYKDRDKFNLCRDNLEYITRSEQARRQKLESCGDNDGNSSKYIGVTKVNRTSASKWSVRCNGVHIGEFADEMHAVYAYDLYTSRANKLGAKFTVNGVCRPKDWNDGITIPEYDPPETTPAKQILKRIRRNTTGQAILQVLHYRRNSETPETIEVIVDDDIWHLLEGLTWSITINRQIRTGKGIRAEYIQAKVIELSDNCVIAPEAVSTIKYINGNNLDNRRSNLRYITSDQQTTDTALSLPPGVPEKDVVYDENLKHWKCTFVSDTGDRKWIGFAATLERALSMRQTAIESQ